MTELEYEKLASVNVSPSDNPASLPASMFSVSFVSMSVEYLVTSFLNIVTSYFPSSSLACYEATFVRALALQHTCDGKLTIGNLKKDVTRYSTDIETNETLNMEAGREAGLSEGETFTLANFSYSNSVIVQRMFHYLSTNDFIRITVRFL